MNTPNIASPTMAISLSTIMEIESAEWPGVSIILIEDSEFVSSYSLSIRMSGSNGSKPSFP